MPDYKKLYLELMGRLADIADISVAALNFGEDAHLEEEKQTIRLLINNDENEEQKTTLR